MANVATQTESTTDESLDKGGKYLAFALGQEEYAIEILKASEIIGYKEIADLPQSPEYVKGVIDLRGRAIPIIDLRLKLGIETAGVTEETCIIIVEISHQDRKFSAGIIVDQAHEVLDIDGQNIKDAQRSDSAVNADFIIGMDKTGDKARILLDIDKVLQGDDFSGLAAETA